jgi:hypothetical protein
VDGALGGIFIKTLPHAESVEKSSSLVSCQDFPPS